MTVSAQPKRRRGWFSFSLRAMLLALTVFGVSLGWWANLAHEQRAAVAAIREMEDPFNPTEFGYDYAEDDVAVAASGAGGSVMPGPRPASWVSPTILRFLGEDYFHNVTFAEIGNCVPTADDALAIVSRLKQLRSLKITAYKPATDAGVAHLARLRKLRRLTIDDCTRLNAESYRTLSKLLRLESLELQNAHPTDDDLEELSKLTSLKRLVLLPPKNSKRLLPITQRGFEALARLTNLEELKLGSAPFESVDVTSLLALGRLKQLTLLNSRVAEEAVKPLLELPGLDLLSLRGCRVNGSGLGGAPLQSTVLWINFRDTEIDDNAVAVLSRMPNLHGAALERTRVTAKGLEQFQACPTLEYLNVDRFVEQDLLRLRSVLPNCTIE